MENKESVIINSVNKIETEMFKKINDNLSDKDDGIFFNFINMYYETDFLIIVHELLTNIKK
jgi:hypothetical protein